MRETKASYRNLETLEYEEVTKYKEESNVIGKVTVEIFDEATGKKVEEVKGENFISPNLFNNYIESQAGQIFQYIGKNSKNVNGDPLLNPASGTVLTADIFKNVYLTTDNSPENPSKEYIMKGFVVGTQDRFKNASPTALYGTYNEAESTTAFRYAKHVFDFPTNCANGIFQSIGFTFGDTQGLQYPQPQEKSRILMASNDSRYGAPTGLEGKSIYGMVQSMYSNQLIVFYGDTLRYQLTATSPVKMAFYNYSQPSTAYPIQLTLARVVDTSVMAFNNCAIDMGSSNLYALNTPYGEDEGYLYTFPVIYMKNSPSAFPTLGKGKMVKISKADGSVQVIDMTSKLPNFNYLINNVFTAEGGTSYANGTVRGYKIEISSDLNYHYILTTIDTSKPTANSHLCEACILKFDKSFNLVGSYPLVSSHLYSPTPSKLTLNCNYDPSNTTTLYHPKLIGVDLKKRALLIGIGSGNFGIHLYDLDNNFSFIAKSYVFSENHGGNYGVDGLVIDPIYGDYHFFNCGAKNNGGTWITFYDAVFPNATYTWVSHRLQPLTSRILLPQPVTKTVGNTLKITYEFQIV